MAKKKVAPSMAKTIKAMSKASDNLRTLPKMAEAKAERITPLINRMNLSAFFRQGAIDTSPHFAECLFASVCPL
jgi:hypothetical protein